MPTSWVYQLRKEDLIRELEKRGKSTENLTVEELRRQLTQMVKVEESYEEVYQDTMAEKGREKNDSMSQNTTCQKIQESFQENTDNIQDGKIWKLWENSIEKWNIHFDGTGDPVGKNLQKREGDVTSPATLYARLPPALPLAPLIRQRAQEIQLRPV
ncbi:hypothetical protein ACJJTC_014569 [Scirpophaga incertulas]